jgi:hypothetical protein
MIVSMNPLRGEVIGDFEDENVVRDHERLDLLEPLVMNLRAQNITELL